MGPALKRDLVLGEIGLLNQLVAREAQIRRIRVIAFSNARMSTRRKPETSGAVLGVPFVCSVLDFARFAEISAARGGFEPIEIDVTAINGAPLPCLPAHSIDGEHASYLVAVPGKFLAEVYGLYGARLLEQNVRTFLQAKTKVNAGIIKTLETQPEMFFAYNNGLTATAAGITTTRMADGSLGIEAIENLQIVNGGQTTASILYASDSQPIPYGGHDAHVWKMRRSDVAPEQMLKGGQVICGMNATRLFLNSAMKRAAGYPGDYPVGRGEKIICLKNRHDLGLINGLFVDLSDIRDEGPLSLSAKLTTEDGTAIPGRQWLYKGHFDDHVHFDRDRGRRDWRQMKGLVEVVWGYAITCHKAQGSSYPTAVVWDDGLGRTAEDRARWLYTAITRAEWGLVLLD